MQTLEIRRHSMRKSGGGSQLSQEGVAYAMRLGAAMGPFARVVTSVVPRTRETAIAMGFAVDYELVTLTFDVDVYTETDASRWWEAAQPFAALAAGMAAKGAMWRYGHALAALWRDILTALPEGGASGRSTCMSPRVAEYPITTLVAEILAPKAVGPLLLVNARTSWQSGCALERELEAVAAARLVEEIVGGRSVHVVVASDLNAAPDAASVRFWCGRQSLNGMSICYQDAWERRHPGEPGHTFSPRNPLVASGEMPLERGRRIDYILVLSDN